MITMYDAVTAANIPMGAEAAAYYVDGHFANGTAVRERKPKRLLSITVSGGDADCCDCETGDMTIAQAEEWVARMLAAGHYRPVVYADLDRWEHQGLRSGLAKYGGKIRRWVAAYDNNANIPTGYDAHQYSTGNVDKSVCLPDFFDGPPKPLPHARGKAHFAGTVNIETGEWTIHGLPGIGVHFAGPKRRMSAEVQLDVGAGGGEWRVQGMPMDAEPLGK